MNPDSTFSTSRRQFITTTGAALAATALSSLPARAQGQPKYRRVKMTNGQAPLDSYREAISKMLTLPPEHPHNWYRNALVHTLDCPHGNWWFLPWHRGYIGYFEQICRKLSGNANFALPYWDWTEYPRIPDAFYDGLLTPMNAAFIASYQEFENQFKNPVSALWASFSPSQLQQLAVRAYNDNGDTYQTPDDLWKSIKGNPPALPPYFFPRRQARSLVKSFPCFDPSTRMAVSAATLRTALAASTFTAFGSGKVGQHSESTDQGILESQPHNLVHNNIGGFMGDLMSPVDPIFFMHHSNIDRLWEVWNRRQIALQRPTVPQGADLDLWKKEQFLFFVNANGDPVTKNTAGDYVAIGDFDYDYQPGTNEEPPVPPNTFTNKVWSANLKARKATMPQALSADVGLPEALMPAAAQVNGAALFARVTLKPGTEMKDVQYHVLVNPPAGSMQVNFDDPSYAGTFSAFGRHATAAGHAGKPFTFTISLADAVAKLAEEKRLDPNEKLQVQVVAVRKGVTLAPLAIDAVEIAVGAF